MIARDPRATWRYVLVADRKLPKEQQTVFLLKHLTLSEEAALLDGLSRDQYGTTRLGVLRTHLIGWENLRRADGTEVQFDTDPRTRFVKDDLLFTLDMEHRHELAVAIENESVFDPDELGKSEPPST